MTELGLKIKLHRERKGWNQKELAEKADVSPATISGAENGRFTPTPAVLHRIARELGLEFYELSTLYPEPKLDTLLEIGYLYVSERHFGQALNLAHQIQCENPPMQEYQLHQLLYLEAFALTYWEQTRMQGIEALYSLSTKLEGAAHTDQIFAMRVQNALGAAWYRQLDLITALHHYKRAIEMLNSFPQTQDRIVGTIHYNIGNCLRWLGQDREAIVYLEKALPLTLESRNYMSVGGIYFSLGACYQNLHEMQAASEAFREAVPWFEAANSQEFAMQSRSLLYFCSPELRAQALPYLEEELQTLTGVVHPIDESVTLTRIASLHLERGELPQAQTALEKADALSAKHPRSGQRGYFLQTYALYQLAVGNDDAASHYAFEAADLYASLRFFHTDLQESLRIGKQAVLRLREGSERTS
ncbi:helix-turn-helix domain-containing protein [Tumebacillus sp. ITR2]|uniref:Helix-turn-helix domain-containing protein n=1 Tax=Tumebacillus amylolyticus TaxID=2801339 RepID=A0ABS1JHH5_9BACL|nr:helix-turn-helix domain-containing protein [Tumebacillus amylolyticus]MBL0389173.1 helix-turn-helix domain-containing protein [Tumebacillus amylolyticus]